MESEPMMAKSGASKGVAPGAKQHTGFIFAHLHRGAGHTRQQPNLNWCQRFANCQAAIM
jgi:hypothetical protein